MYPGVCNFPCPPFFSYMLWVFFPKDILKVPSVRAWKQTVFLSESFHKEQGKKLAVSALLFQALVFSTERTAFTLLWPLLPWGSHLLVCHFLEGHVFPTLAAFKNLLECSFMIICGFFVYLAWFGWASPISWLHEYWETFSEQHPSPSILSAVSPGLPDLYFLVSSLSVNTSLENPVARCCSL